MYLQMPRRSTIADSRMIHRVHLSTTHDTVRLKDRISLDPAVATMIIYLSTAKHIKISGQRIRGAPGELHYNQT